MMEQTVIAFDAYGTLLSTASIAAKLADHFSRAQADAIATAWRRYQLEYTWRLNSMQQFQSFSNVTRASLRHALAENKAELADDKIDDLMVAYDSLDTFPDVEPCLTALSDKGMHCVVFSNGTDAMVSASVYKSPGLKGVAKHFKDIVTVDEAKRFKPEPSVYHLLARRVGKDPSKPEDMGSLWLVSGNPFDIVGARAVGMKTAWVARGGAEWQDELVSDANGKPHVVLKSLEDLVAAVTGAV